MPVECTKRCFCVWDIHKAFFRGDSVGVTTGELIGPGRLGQLCYFKRIIGYTNSLLRSGDPLDLLERERWKVQEVQSCLCIQISDSTGGRGICQPFGVGKIRHLELRYVWIHGFFFSYRVDNFPIEQGGQGGNGLDQNILRMAVAPIASVAMTYFGYGCYCGWILPKQEGEQTRI